MQQSLAKQLSTITEKISFEDFVKVRVEIARPSLVWFENGFIHIRYEK